MKPTNEGIYTKDECPNNQIQMTDRFTLGTKRKYTHEGYLIIEDCILARTGIQEYFAAELNLTDRKPDAKIRVYRPEEEVFSQESIDSFKLKPITNEHPDKMVSPETIKRHQIGTIGNDVRRDGDFMKASLIFTDKKAIKEIEDGKTELSNGYLSGYTWEPGTAPTGDKYDAKQKNIIGNHTALVERGRCGSACSVADSKTNLKPKTQEIPMEFEIVQVGDLQVKVAVDHAPVLRKLMADEATKLEQLQKERDELKTKLDENASAMEKLKGEKDEAEAEKKKAEDALPSADSIDSLVDARIAFRDTVQVLDKDFCCKGKDEATIRRELVQAANKDTDLSGKSDDYIEARFDSMVAAAKDGKGKGGQDAMDKALGDDVTNNKDKDGKDEVISSKDARATFMKKNNTANNVSEAQ